MWAWAIEPQLVVPTVIFGSFLGQMISIHGVRRDVRLGRVSPFLIGGLLGVPVGSRWYKSLSDASFTRYLFLVLLLSGLTLVSASIYKLASGASGAG